MRVTKRHRVHRKSGHAAAQNFQFGLPQTDGQGTKIGAPIGGSARGYQGLPAPLAIPATATQTAARSYFYASPALT